MEQKKVKITGLAINKAMGIVQACKMDFDPENRLIAIKGEVGAGKSTVQKAIQLGTQGRKTLQDSNLYGDIATEVQLLDGETNIWVGTKNKDGKISHIVYTKDAAGKICKSPVIDGEKATPSAYLAALQTELTWHLDELTSENPNTQRDILLKLYQHELKQVGVVFDKKLPSYEGSILHKIEKAEQERDQADYQRKQEGGIKEDLQAQGFDPDRPESIPDAVDIQEINTKIRSLEKEITVLETKAGAGKEARLSELKNKSTELKNKCIEYNLWLQKEHEKAQKKRDQAISDILAENETRKEKIETCATALKVLQDAGFKDFLSIEEFIVSLPIPTDDLPPEKVQEPDFIKMDGEKVAETDVKKPYVAEIEGLRIQYKAVLSDNTAPPADTALQKAEIKKLNETLKNAGEINRVVSAVDAFHHWRAKNGTVMELKKEYMQLLSKINTGVTGLKIGLVDEKIFLMYNGAYDPEYFGNVKKEYRKLSSYSDTQKPMVCMLVQNYLLNKKPKAMRYLFIDRIPIDNKTRKLIENMCIELDLHVFLNITGDFSPNELEAGEILIEGGEVFFN